MNSRIIVITGTPGAGKSTVLNAAMDKFSAEVKVLNYANVMLEVGEALGLGGDHDAIRKLELDKQRGLQKKAAEKIAKGAAGGITIVDTHATIKTPKGYLPGLPEWVVRALTPEIIVLVEANPAEILGRRTRDATRKRDGEAVTGIDRHQQINRAAAMAAAELCGAAVKIIENHDDGLEKAAAELAEVIGG